ncbi:MAG: tricarballylate dehydrogenase [Chloroflexi bacterium]|nr:tricarballylate dehydrogenase [Chloroflexota bacterium]|tara:strand:+ start:1866 stop:3347 length:1482 start_codon:yes stop_codon:yes gene_type:complete
MPKVVVVGAGNAALCAALAASEHNVEVTVLEKADQGERGGNTFFTGGGFRFPYNGIEDILELIPDLSDEELAKIEVGSYPESAMRSDLFRVTEGQADDGMVEHLVRNAYDTVRWMREHHNQRWVLMYGRQAYEVDGKLKFWGGMITEAVGGGEGLSDRLFSATEEAGIEIRYGCRALGLVVNEQNNAVIGVKVKTRESTETISADAIILAAGGFESNVEMRTRYLGAGWEFAKIRGTRHNMGDMIRAAIDIGAQPYGHWSSGHAVAWDVNAPPTGNRRIGDLYQKHSYPLGMIVNVNGERFVDEGADFRNYTYAKYGREILKQPLGIAFQLFDQQTVSMLRDEYRIREITKAEGNTIEELADALGIDVGGLKQTVEQFNDACQSGDYNPAILDGVKTEGIEPPKSNWALPLNQPPYFGVAVTTGLTFTFGGLKINPKTAQVLDTDDIPIRGLYATGELVGGLFFHNYAGGTGLMSGAVFGRTAGASAAQQVTL